MHAITNIIVKRIKLNVN